MKVHMLAEGSGLISGLFALCGTVDPKEWNSHEGGWKGVTCRRCLAARTRRKP